MIWNFLFQTCMYVKLPRTGFPIVCVCVCVGGGRHEGDTPPAYNFFWNPLPLKPMPPPSGAPPLTWSSPHWSSPRLINEAPFQEMIPSKKNPQNWKLSLILCLTHKTTLVKDGRNCTKMWFSHLEHSKFCKESETVC